MAPRPNASFGQTPWTVPYSTHSSSACARRSGCRNSRPRCRRAPASPSPCCRSCSRRSTRRSSAGSSRSSPTTPTRATPPRPRLVRRRRPGRAPPVARRALGLRARAGRRTWSASARGRSRCSRRGGLVCASAAARRRGPATGRRAAGAARVCAPATSPASSRSPSTSPRRGTSASSASRSAGSSPSAAASSTSSRRPAASRSAIELFGDEIEQIRAFSPFTQRALRQVETATVYPGRRAAARARRDRRCPTTSEDAPQVDVPTDLVPPFDRAPDLVWSPDEVRAVWAEEGFAPIELDGCDGARSAAAGPAVLVRRAAAGARGARALRGGERAGRAAAAGARHRRRVPAPRRGAAPAGAAAPQHRAHARTG